MRAILLVIAILILATLFLLKSLLQVSDPQLYDIWDETKPLHRIDSVGLEVLQQGPFTVYFPPQHKLQAEEVARALDQSWQVVKRRLGLDLGGFSVVIVLLREDMGGVFIERWEEGSVPWPLVGSMRWQSLQEAPLYARYSVYVVFPHEAAHHVLGFEGRWLEEGLAEYIGYVVSQELDPEVHRLRLEESREGVQTLLPTTTYYDLTREPPLQLMVKDKIRIKRFSSEESAGYGVSLAFWLQIAQQHGEEVIRQLLERARQLQRPSEQELARILSELTGEDIWNKLQQMDLQEVLQTLEQARR